MEVADETIQTSQINGYFVITWELFMKEAIKGFEIFSQYQIFYQCFI